MAKSFLQKISKGRWILRSFLRLQNCTSRPPVEIMCRTFLLVSVVLRALCGKFQSLELPNAACPLIRARKQQAFSVDTHRMTLSTYLKLCVVFDQKWFWDYFLGLPEILS